MCSIHCPCLTVDLLYAVSSHAIHTASMGLHARAINNFVFSKHYITKIFKDAHLVVMILTITGFAVVLLLLGTAIPQLRGTPTEERDSEFPSGFTVYIKSSCMKRYDYNY